MLVAVVDVQKCGRWSFKAVVLSIKPSINTDQCELTVISIPPQLVVTQLCNFICWHLDSNCCRTRCRQLRLVLSSLTHQLVMLQSDIPIFSLPLPAKHILKRWSESTRRIHLDHLGGMDNSYPNYQDNSYPGQIILSTSPKTTFTRDNS